MNIREAGARSARRLTATIGVAAAAVASILGLSIWAGTAAASSHATIVQGDDGGRGDDDGAVDGGNVNGGTNGFGTSNGFVAPGQGGGSHGNSNGS
ncbi:hypothetical protein ACFPJ4_01050 [Lysinimonas soli]|uniref:Uncharacterized protein n=1 Tax=Lysinimonas soli TaxID=1074233 RepID=A0ABW0NKJ7_9MICO